MALRFNFVEIKQSKGLGCINVSIERYSGYSLLNAIMVNYSVEDSHTR